MAPNWVFRFLDHWNALLELFYDSRILGGRSNFFNNSSRMYSLEMKMIADLSDTRSQRRNPNFYGYLQKYIVNLLIVWWATFDARWPSLFRQGICRYFPRCHYHPCCQVWWTLYSRKLQKSEKLCLHYRFRMGSSEREMIRKKSPQRQCNENSTSSNEGRTKQVAYLVWFLPSPIHECLRNKRGKDSKNDLGVESQCFEGRSYRQDAKTLS